SDPKRCLTPCDSRMEIPRTHNFPPRPSLYSIIPGVCRMAMLFVELPVAVETRGKNGRDRSLSLRGVIKPMRTLLGSRGLLVLFACLALHSGALGDKKRLAQDPKKPTRLKLKPGATVSWIRFSPDGKTVAYNQNDSYSVGSDLKKRNYK